MSKHLFLRQLLDTRRAPLNAVPRSINEADRTCELVASTGAEVWREDIVRGRFREVLRINSEAVDLSRAAGMPLLDSHQQDGVDRVLGVVRSLRIENGQLIATVHVSDEAVWEKIKRGVLGNVSVGYSIEQFRDEGDTRTVTRWTPHEISLVPIGADPAARVRSDLPHNIQTRAAVNNEIRALVETAGLPHSVADRCIDENLSLEESRGHILDAVLANNRRRATRAAVVVEHDTPEQRARQMGEALFARSNPRHQLSEPARRYAPLSLADMARDSLTRAGVSTIGFSALELVQRASYMTTSDFPNALANTLYRSLRARYEVAPAVLKRVARQATARDFRAKTSIQISEAPTLLPVPEGADYRYGALDEAKETYAVKKFGRILAVSWEAMINDDIAALNDVAGALGDASAEFEAQTLVDLLVSNSGTGPLLDDGKALFHVDHDNLAGTPAAPDETSLGLARLALRRQVGISGKPINLQPRFLLCAPELETDCEKLLATITPTQTADVNPFGGKLELLVDARLLDPLAWYVIADPARAVGLEFSYLSGNEGPTIDTRVGFTVDGIETKCRLVFGCAFLDYRSWYRNAGSAT